MKLTLQNIRNRKREMRKIKEASKESQSKITEAKSLLEHHEMLLQKDIEYVKPFIATQPENLQHFIKYYYFKLYSERIYHAEFSPKKNSGNYGTTCRRAVERAAERWYEH